MSDVNQARRTSIEVFFSGVDITESMKKYFLSLTYTDNEEDETDDLQIKLQDRDGIWLTQWLNKAIQAAAEGASANGVGSQNISYKVIAKSGVSVHSRAGSQYFVYGTLAYGSVITVHSISDGWANFTYSGKNAYVNAASLQALNDSGASISTEGIASKGLRIQAVIVRENWDSTGKDEVLECGQFELDSVVASGPPATITIKGTSLPYNTTIRQMQKSKSWEKYTLSGIANEIADKNGMTCMFLSDTDPSYTRVEQYKMSDITFLQKLCRDAGCSLKVSNNIIVIFDQMKYENKPVIRTISRGKAGGYTKYKLSTGENDKYTSCRVSYTAANGSLITATAYVDDYSKDNENNQCLEIRQKVSSTAEAITLAQKMLRLHNKYEFMATFTLPGDTALLAGCTVLLNGWGAWDGKYIIKQAKHSVSHSGYTTQVVLRKALSSETANSNNGGTSSFAVGDMVMLTSDATVYGTSTKYQPWVYGAALYVRSINGSRVVVSIYQEGAVTGAVDIKHLKRYR